MGKTKKNGGKPAGKAENRPEAIKVKAPAAEAREAAVLEPVAKAVEKPAERGFDIAAYARSLKWLYPLALLVIVVVMFYFRAVPSHDAVFTSWAGNYVNVAQDDAVMHMRLVHNTLAHFPERVFYDPFTHFPFGSKIHFGPVFTLLIAGTSLIAGLGNPSTGLVDTIGAYMPCALGALCAIPAYFIGKRMFGRNAGIVSAATLALLPGQFLVRSLLGFTDHHIAEVLFSITAIAFLVYALDAAKASGLNFARLKSREKGALKAVLLASLAGFTFGVYMLTWTGGLLVGFMIFIYFVIQAVVDHLAGHRLEYLVITAAAMFVVPAVMLLPYSLSDLSFELMYYSITQPVFLLLAFAAVAVIYGLSQVLRKSKAEAWTFPVSLVGIGVVGLLLTYLLAPQIYGLMMAGFQVFAPSGGMLWVAEAKPSYLNSAGAFDLSMLWSSFLFSFYISIIALIMLAFRVFKDNRPAEWLFFVWSVIMLWAALSQIRFTYYFAVNAALLTGYFVHAVFRALDWGRFEENWRKRVKTLQDARTFVGKNSGQAGVFACLGLLFVGVIAFPATSLSIYGVNGGDLASGKQPLFDGITEEVAKLSSGMGYEWYSTLLWMKNNTPDPQGDAVSPTFDYASGKYKAPANGERYSYPSSAYGVMSWWDYGHIITYVAERIPNANPFQAGILENNNTGGSARFFLATTEDQGYENLQNLGSRYVVIDNQMATGKFYAITVWADDREGWDVDKSFAFSADQSANLPVDSAKYHSSMMNRLYYDDCNDMGHFRLVYESPGNYYVKVRRLFMENGNIQSFAQASVANYTTAYEMYAGAIKPMSWNNGDEALYDARPPVKWVKVYEVVKGATITGHAAPGTNVTATLGLATDDRTFSYSRTAVADQNGDYSLTVSYPTETMKGKGYAAAVTPAGSYTLTAGNQTVQIAVPESAVMNGGTITVP